MNQHSNIFIRFYLCQCSFNNYHVSHEFCNPFLTRLLVYNLAPLIEFPDITTAMYYAGLETP